MVQFLLFSADCSSELITRMSVVLLSFFIASLGIIWISRQSADGMDVEGDDRERVTKSILTKFLTNAYLMKNVWGWTLINRKGPSFLKINLNIFEVPSSSACGYFGLMRPVRGYGS